MKEKNTYTTEVVREGLTQYKFSGHGYTLSVGTGEGHYSNSHEGTVEIAILNEHGELINLSAYDQVAEYQPMSRVGEFINVLENRQDAWACHRFFHHYFEPCQIG
tara:strand:- start:106 stop:420 length:315 start_codon:yes stop_codon:yes gene_type:complete